MHLKIRLKNRLPSITSTALVPPDDYHLTVFAAHESPLQAVERKVHLFFLNQYSSSQLRHQEKLKMKKRKKRDVFERRFHKCSNLLNRENNCKLINQQTGTLFPKCSLFFDLSELPLILF